MWFHPNPDGLGLLPVPLLLSAPAALICWYQVLRMVFVGLLRR